MPQLRNTPPARTLLRLEARKSFSFSLRLVDSESRPVDVTGCTFTIVAKPYPLVVADPTDALNIIANDTAEIVDAVDGHVKFDLQASDTSVTVGEYPFVITMRTPAGYSIVLVKGTLEILENPEYASTGTTYIDENVSTALEVLLQDQVVLNVAVGGLLPPGMHFLSSADKAKLDGLTILDGDVEVDLEGYATRGYAEQVALQAKSDAQAYTEAVAAPVTHTHRVINLDGISVGTAAASGGAPGDLYLRYIP